MTQLKNPTAGGAPSGIDLQLEDLTREQKTALSRIIHRFRETAVGQVLVGPAESGKSTLAEMVGNCLSEQAEVVLISKSQDPGGGQKRLLFEAYGTYSYFLSAVLKQLGFFVRGEEHDLVEQLVEQLRKLRSEDKRLLLIIDDAQDIAPTVWKRLQPWLDYQDRGVRMIQVLLVGTPDLKKKLNEPAMRAWRRWVHGTYDLNRIQRWGCATDEARRMLKRACDLINAKTQPTEPIRPPQISWLAIQKIVKEAGGRPGRMNELLKRALSASIREGGSRITYRFLAKADALRSPAMQWYKLRQSEGATAAAKTSDSKKKKLLFNLRGKSMKERTQNPRIPEHPLGWMRYALGTLLVVFMLGAGWGITSWLSIQPNSSSYVLTEETLPESEIVESLDPVEVSENFETAAAPVSEGAVVTTEPVEEYPLDVFEQEEDWKTIDPVAVSQTISASLEQEFMSLEASGSQTAQNFLPVEQSVPPRDSTVLTAEVPIATGTVEALVPPSPADLKVTGTESPLETLEDYTLPERAPLQEEIVKTESKPLDAKALDVPEELLHQTVSTGVVSIPAPTAPQKSERTASAAKMDAPPPKPVTSAPAKPTKSKDRLLKAMNKLEKSLK